MLAPAREPGQLVAEKYRLVRHLGTGSMGAVHEARNEWTRRKVAIKFLRPELGADPEGVRRFLREAQSAARVSHPGIVEILDAGRAADDGSLYIVQEFLTGETLRAKLAREGALPVEEALRIALPLLDALCAAHRGGVVHRDLKPENIFVVENPNGQRQPKLIDFGFAKVRRRRRPVEDTATHGDAVGTPRYMAPEQFSGERGLDGRVDIWAMGVVLFEMIGGGYPHEATQLFELMNQVRFQRARPLTEVCPACPADLAAVVARALEAERERRYPSAAALLSALLACEPAEPFRRLPFVAYDAGRATAVVEGRSITDLDEGWDVDGPAEESVTAVPALLDARGAFNNDARGAFDNDARGAFNNDARGAFNNDARGAFNNDARGALNNETGLAAPAPASAPHDTARIPTQSRTARRPAVRSPEPPRQGGFQLWPHGVLAALLVLIAALVAVLLARK